MSWLKHVLLDIAFTVATVVFALADQPRWLWWVIVVYSGIMLLLKLTAVSSPTLTELSGRSVREVPAWFFHVLYAVSVLALLYARWYWMAGVWGVIWVLSLVAEARAKRPAASPVAGKRKTPAAPRR